MTITSKLDSKIEGPIEVSTSVTSSPKFYNSSNLPPKVIQKSELPSMTQLSPLDAKSPQDILDQHNMYRKESVYKKQPEMIYGDFTEIGDYESHLNKCIELENKFAKLDPEVRGRFNNSVLEFTRACRSKDFNIESVLTQPEVDSYREYKKRQEADAKHLEYLESPEYKALIEQSKLRQEYETQKYNEWLNSRNKN